MAPTSCTSISAVNRAQLLATARRAIEAHLQGGELNLNLADYEEEITREGACFVTLRDADGELRGCIGSLDSHQALIVDVAENAVSAATRDFRFRALTKTELDACHIEISVLTPKELMPVSSESELLRSMEPQVDGIVIDSGRHRATFLPKVWESLHDKKAFLQHLKTKAGLGINEWPHGMKCYRYRAIDFAEEDLEDLGSGL